MRRFHLGVVLALAIASLFGLRLAAGAELDAIAERAKVRHDEVPRKVLAFYYPWYGNPSVEGGSGRWSHWSNVEEDKQQIASSTHYPTLGAYDSHDPALIARHCGWAKEAGVDGFIASWWEKDTFTDQALQRILDGCQDAKIEATIYYESVPGPRNARSAADDVLYVLNRYGKHPAWLTVDGKPVVFIYGRAIGQIGLQGWLEAISQVNKRYPGGAIFIGDQISRFAAATFDGVHTYNTCGALRSKGLPEVRQWAKTTYPGWVKTADAFRRISTITVIPGYDDTKIRTPGLRVERHHGALYRCQWEEAIAADPHWILITSWNEWHEGSEIEPSVEDQDQYLKMTARCTARFKSKGPRVRPPLAPEPGQIPEEEKGKQLENLRGVKIGLLPEPALSVVWPLLRLPEKPALVSWEEVAGWTSSAAEAYPVVIYSADETYRRTVSKPGDVDEGLLRYLRAGGFLVVVPSGPMPFHYDQRGEVAASSRKLGLPLSVSGPGGGWEQPPEETNLQLVQVGRRLPHLPEVFPFPEQGDRRWRPFLRSQLAEGDLVVPLLELRDDQGKHYGDAVAYVEHRTSEPKNGKVLYVWFGLLHSPHGEALLHDVLAFVGRKVAGGTGHLTLGRPWYLSAKQGAATALAGRRTGQGSHESYDTLGVAPVPFGRRASRPQKWVPAHCIAAFSGEMQLLGGHIRADIR